jgi:hypothetical protein
MYFKKIPGKERILQSINTSDVAPGHFLGGEADKGEHINPHSKYGNGGIQQ